MAMHITDITEDLDPDTTVVVNCAGRTRSIIGTRVLQRMGLTNIVGLKNGTSGWVLAGYELETGADRIDPPAGFRPGIGRRRGLLPAGLRPRTACARCRLQCSKK